MRHALAVAIEAFRVSLTAPVFGAMGAQEPGERQQQWIVLEDPDNIRMGV